MGNTEVVLEYLKNEIKDLYIKEIGLFKEDRKDSVFYFKGEELIFEYIEKYNYLRYNKYLFNKMVNDFGFKKWHYEKIDVMNNFFKDVLNDYNLKYFTINYSTYEDIENFINGDRIKCWRL